MKERGNTGERPWTPSASPDDRDHHRNDFAHLPTPPVALVGRADGVVIRRNPNADVRIADRQRRESVTPLQRGAPRHDPPYEAYHEYDPPNAAYRDWHESAWAGRRPNPPAEYRCHGGNEGYQAEAEVRGRNEGWRPHFVQSNWAGRQRTRTPNRGPNRNREAWRDEQNMRYQYRKNVEYQRDRAAATGVGLGAMD